MFDGVLIEHINFLASAVCCICGWPIAEYECAGYHLGREQEVFK